MLFPGAEWGWWNETYLLKKRRKGEEEKARAASRRPRESNPGPLAPEAQCTTSRPRPILGQDGFFRV